jgi:hypothetical protein
MSENQEVSTITSAKDIIFSQTAMGQMNQLATMMASSVCTVPKHLQGNVGDCFAIALQAAQWGMNPFAVAQKTHLVSGVLGYESQLVNAVITTMAPTKGRLKFEWFGDWSKVIGNFKEVQGQKGTYRKLASTLADEKGCGVRVFATLRDEDEPRVLELLLTQAGVRNSTLWADDPKQQLAYLAIKRWSRLYCPDVIMGVYSQDELENIPAEKEINPLPGSKTEGESEGEELTRLDKLLLSIKIMSIEDFKSIDPAPFSVDERKTIRKAMTARKEEIIAQKQASVVADIVAEPIDWATKIKSCGSDVELNELLSEIPDDVQIELSDVIDDQFDLLG